MRELAEIIKESREKKGTQTAIAGRLKVVTSQQLGSYERGDYKPKADFFEAWKREFGEDLLAMQKGIIQRNVSHETEKGTYVEIPKQNTGNEMDAKETFYRDLIEGNDDYSLMPRAVLKDYKIVPERILDVIIKSADSEKQALIEKHELIIEGMENKIARLEREKEALQKENEDLQRQIPAKHKG